jgi:DNA-binding MurR/RpiR family transcriptional regulator
MARGRAKPASEVEDALRTLAHLIPVLPPHLRRAGARILDHPNEVAVSSMRGLAAKAAVTPPTMLRLARRAGFDSYASFRAVFQRAVTGSGFGARAASLQELGHAGDAGVIAQIVHAASSDLEGSFTTACRDELVRAAELLAAARGAYAIGVGALHWMSAYLHYLARAVLPGLRVARANGNSLAEEIVGIGRGDVAVILSVAPYATQTLRAAELARDAGASIVAITDSRASPLAANSDVVLLARTESPQFYPSMVAVIATIEALVALIVARGDRATIRRIATIDRLRRTEGGYLEA